MKRSVSFLAGALALSVLVAGCSKGTKAAPSASPGAKDTSATDAGATAAPSLPPGLMDATKGPSPAPSPMDAAKAAKEAKEIFNNGNGGGVSGGGKLPTFHLDAATQITSITTYHYTGHGKLGTISIEGKDGTTYGPFRATGGEGQGGVPNAYWIVAPEGLVLLPGTYTVVDSDPKSFSQNAESRGIGMAWGSGVVLK